MAVAWPKGFVREPTGGERFGYFVSDNRSTIVAAIGLLVVFAYYLVTWARVGRDPEGGVIVPLYEPPAGLSPAATRYLTKMGWDDRVLSASLISMAVKGFLTITQNDGSFTLKREGAYRELSPEEKIVADKLFSKGDTIALTRSNRTRVKAALDGLKARLKTTLQKVYFFTNRRYLVPGIVLSVLAVAAVALTPTGPEKFGALFICVWLAFWSLGVGVLLFATWNAWKAGLAGGIGSKAAALFMTAFSVPFVLGELAGAYILVEMTSIGVLIALISIIALNVVFHYLLKAPTRAGRDLLDEIEGFKMYLAAVEEHRWNVLHPPDRTPGTFEKFLPYALALDVEQEWSEQFADVLSDASREGDTGYRPTWYSGRSWDVGRAATFASRVGDAMSVAVATSSSRPSGSSSGFSGGSSGGGGGGGGGGGW